MLLTVSVSSQAKDNDLTLEQIAGLNEIVLQLCQISKKGWESKVEITGYGSSRIFARFVSLGLEGDFSKTEWEGIKPSTDNLSIQTECVIAMTPMLLTRLIPTDNTSETPFSMKEQIVALEWYERICPVVHLFVPYGPGGTSDHVARVFSFAFSDSGMDNTLRVRNFPGMHNELDSMFKNNGSFDGCTLGIIKSENRTSFPTPYMNMKIGENWRSVVLPSGIVSEVAENWKAILYKIENDPDFQRRLKVDLVVNMEYTESDMP